jgi:hypothetical protein
MPKQELDSPKVSGSPVDDLDGDAVRGDHIAENSCAGNGPLLGNRQALD